MAMKWFLYVALVALLVLTGCAEGQKSPQPAQHASPDPPAAAPTNKVYTIQGEEGNPVRYERHKGKRVYIPFTTVREVKKTETGWVLLCTCFYEMDARGRNWTEEYHFPPSAPHLEEVGPFSTLAIEGTHVEVKDNHRTFKDCEIVGLLSPADGRDTWFKSRPD